MSKVLTVDFDDTLASSNEDFILGHYSLSPIERVIDFVKEKHKEGWEVHIVTFRHSEHKKEVEDFCKDYDIPVSSIVCTSSNPKTPFLLKLKSNLHVDDHVETLVLAANEEIDTLLVNHDQEKYNSTAKLFNKI